MNSKKDRFLSILKNIANTLVVFFGWALINLGICWFVKETHLFFIGALVSVSLTAIMFQGLLPDKKTSGETGFVSSMLFLLVAFTTTVFVSAAIYFRAELDLGLYSMWSRGEFLMAYGAPVLAILTLILFGGFKGKKLNILTAFCPIMVWLPVTVMTLIG